ncbi:MAG TPA: hypothetical protein VK524_34925 [Polyangiaceae bacterium]|nr:hypothetical protein [Polyangiaceae bacterium]
MTRLRSSFTISCARTLRALSCGVALSLPVLLAAPPASAQDIPAAANAYSTGQKAEMAGDHEAAADMYELADSLAPTPEAVRSALRARKNAGQLGAAAVHAETLISRYPDDKRSRGIAESTLAEAKKKLARYAVRCQPKPCNLVVDGASATTNEMDEHVLYLSAGEHSVIARFGKLDTEAQPVSGEPGGEASLTFDAPPEPPPEATPAGEPLTGAGGGPRDAGPQPSSGLPLSVFVTGAAVTVGLGAVTLWSGLDTLKARDEYRDSKTKVDWERGKDREKRTNILIGATAAAGVFTGVVAFLTDWRGQPEQSAAKVQKLQVSSYILPSGGVMSVKGSF